MSQPPLRLAELVATLSIAADLGTGHPMERALRACLLALEIGEALGCDEAALADCYYVALLRYAGCAADARHRAALFGDEIALGPEIDMVELWQLGPMLAFLHRHGFDRLPPAQLETLMATGVQRSVEAAIATCEIGQSLSGRLGLGPGVARALGDVFERWDGRGVPGRAAGEGIALAARIVTVALDAELFYRAGGISAVQTLLRERAGGQYDPAIVTLLQARPALCDVLEAASPWEAVLEREPGPRPRVAEAALDEALRAVADFVDLRLPMTSGHSTAVATLCGQAGTRLGLGDAELAALRRAAYLHDLGTASVSVSVWEKAGPLNADEWERVRLHPYTVGAACSHGDVRGCKPRLQARSCHVQEVSPEHRSVAMACILRRPGYGEPNVPQHIRHTRRPAAIVLRTATIHRCPACPRDPGAWAGRPQPQLALPQPGCVPQRRSLRCLWL